jgi:antitoxin (DNA-binding transcriptional repressor) of toxin-antitoxin stability system
MDEGQANRETVVITKHGKPVAKLIPVEKDADDIYNFLAGKSPVRPGGRLYIPDDLENTNPPTLPKSSAVGVSVSRP